MDIHVKKLGLLSVAFGIVGGLAALVSLIATGGLSGLYRYFDAPMMGAIAVTLVVLQLATALPSIFGGIFVRSYHSWARTLLIVTSALNALNPPFGTLLGAYGLWVLLSPEVEPLFEDAPPARSPHRRPVPGRKIERPIDQQKDSNPPLKSDLKRATGLE